MKMISKQILTASLFVSVMAQAQVIAPSAKEVTISYTATFLKADDAGSDKDAATDHASHIFGVLQSAELVEKYGLDSSLVGGTGAPRLPQDIKVLGRRKVQGQTEVSYQVSSVLLAHKKVAAAWLKAGEVTLPLPYDMSKIFDEKCTDEHYNTEGDYWYFYNVFRSGCTYLTKEPYSKNVKISVTAGPVVDAKASPRLDILHSDNGNGDLFSIYVVHGYAEDATTKGDDGRKNFRDFNRLLLDRGFNERIYRADTSRPMHVYRKSVTRNDGTKIDIEVRNLLVDTAIDSKTTTFAKYFKEAVENADVVIYAGHSGLGGNLDIPSLEEKAGAFNFDNSKRQLFFFDSCSSYSYYLDTFGNAKSKKSIDILTNGLSSYFETSTIVHEAFLDVLLDPEANDDWMTLLKKMEAPLDGGSYFLNAGAL